MLQIFQYDFMIRALIAGLMIGVVAPIIGTFLVVRRFSLIADTLAHVSLVGIAIGLLLKIDPLITALITTLIASLGIERLRESKKIYEESILAIFLSGSLATAVVLISLARGLNANLFNYLFGSITTVTSLDLVIITLFGIFTVGTIMLIYKEFFFIAFDEELALAQGVRAKLLNILLVSLAAIAVSLSMRIVGILLTGALMIIPVLTTIQWTKSFKNTLGLSILFSLLAVTSGLFISFFANTASGGTIVVIALVLFVVSWGINNK
jgi:zinc transport system permease protein